MDIPFWSGLLLFRKSSVSGPDVSVVAMEVGMLGMAVIFCCGMAQTQGDLALGSSLSLNEVAQRWEGGGDSCLFRVPRNVVAEKMRQDHIRHW